MTDRKLRWGVISTANIGRAAVNPAIAASRNGELLAVASRSAERAAAFASAHDIAAHYGSYDALLIQPDIDAVYIPLPNSEHRRWTIRAAERGKHVLCEKPLGLTEAECRDMHRAAEANGVRLMEAFMYRFHPRTERLVAMAREQAVGQLRAIRSSFTFRLTRPDNIRLQPELGGGSLMDVGCYCVNVSRTIAGEEPIEAQAFAVRGGTGVDAQMAGSLRFPSGALAQFDCALTIERREAVEVVGTDGALYVAEAFLPGTDDAAIDVRRGRAAVEHIAVPGADEYRLMVEHFAEGVLTGRPFRYDALEAGRNMRAIEALYRSARSGGNVVALPPDAR